ncbi:MAG TPA: hypothetical protein VF595_15100 [Tepidisphaeraceae bacterium]
MSESAPVSSPPPSAFPAPPHTPDARDRLHALADALVRQRDPHLLRQYLTLRSSLR